MICQTANSLQYLGPGLGLVRQDMASRLWHGLFRHYPELDPD